MARPREFDENEVLEKALAVFWERGYEGVSLADIEAATGLGRASIYAAFGDKEGLFVKVLDRFRCRYEDFEQLLASGASVREGFERVLQAWFDRNCAANSPRGCLVQVLASSRSEELPRARALVEESAKRLERIFRKALERARAGGELRADASPLLLARFLAVGLQGLSSAARGGASRRELEPVATLLLDGIFAH